MKDEHRDSILFWACCAGAIVSLILALVVVSKAASTIDTTQPVDSSDLVPTPIRGNFSRAKTEIEALQAKFPSSATINAIPAFNDSTGTLRETTWRVGDVTNAIVATATTPGAALSITNTHSVAGGISVVSTGTNDLLGLYEDSIASPRFTVSDSGNVTINSQEASGSALNIFGKTYSTNNLMSLYDANNVLRWLVRNDGSAGLGLQSSSSGMDISNDGGGYTIHAKKYAASGTAVYVEATSGAVPFRVKQNAWTGGTGIQSKTFEALGGLIADNALPSSWQGYAGLTLYSSGATRISAWDQTHSGLTVSNTGTGDIARFVIPGTCNVDSGLLSGFDCTLDWECGSGTCATYGYGLRVVSGTGGAIINTPSGSGDSLVINNYGGGLVLDVGGATGGGGPTGDCSPECGNLQMGTDGSVQLTSYSASGALGVDQNATDAEGIIVQMAGTTAAAVQAESPRGAKTETYFAESNASLSTVSSKTFTGLIPAGSLVLGVTVKPIGITGAGSTYDVGRTDNLDVWGDNIAVASATSSASFKVASMTIADQYRTAATDVIVTFNDTVSGSLTATVHYMKLTGPTS